MKAFTEFFATLSDDTKASIRQHMEHRYERNDFDLLEWVNDFDDLADFVFSGQVESEFGLSDLRGDSLHGAARNAVETYLDVTEVPDELVDAVANTIALGIHAGIVNWDKRDVSDLRDNLELTKRLGLDVDMANLPTAKPVPAGVVRPVLAIDEDDQALLGDAKDGQLAEIADLDELMVA